ncbi:MAG: 1-deoxy-D-xylulose-5-phosphate reductoisomerase [Slackia sp.]|nr:1-deoxy-D-xylulose-5-phosphate reductoisomerase [Slackia sp.]
MATEGCVRKRIAVLGSTGSIGQQTLDVVRRHSDELEIVALAANTSVAKVVGQAHEFKVSNIAFGDERLKDDPMLSQAHGGVSIGFGQEGLLDLVRLDEVDVVVNALVGAAGMRASYEALACGKQLALANKESLVVAGDLIMPLAAEVDAQRVAAGVAPASGPAGALMPIDSEHGAIYQCLLGERHEEVSALWVTASGGPFRGKTRDELASMTAKQALAHPTWKMGPKITIDSSTLMNKGLEVIEAHHLFAMPYEKIKVVVQPQSAIHSMVEFSDGSVKAHLGTTDMRIPIQFALSYPDRWDAPVAPLDFTQLGSLEFYPADTETFRCLALARHAGNVGGTLPCVMNAANEVAVAAFLADVCGYLDIDACVEHAMELHEMRGVQRVESLDQLAEVDSWARGVAREFIASK